MEIKDRINRLEVNQMHIIEMLEEVLNRLPEKKSDEIEDPTVPTKDRPMWGKYVQTLREHHYVGQYALKRSTIALNCEYLSTNPKATDDNKKHFSELENTAYEMAGEYLNWTPFSPRSKLQKWYLNFKEKKNVTTPWEFLQSKNFK